MNFQHIWAITLRYLRLFRRDINLSLMTFYWPLLDIILWGFLGVWIQRSQNIPEMKTAFLLGIIYWTTNARTFALISSWLIEELWTKNLINLFSSPLLLSEWILGTILHTLTLNLLVFFYCGILSSFFYKIPLSIFFSSFLIFGPPLIISCIWLGFISTSLLIYFGRRIQEFAWVVSWFFSPFIGVYYPIDILPNWAQKMSSYLPMSYIFKSLRNYILYNQNPWPYLKISYLMSIVYASLAIIFFLFMFNKTKQKGLTRLTN